VLRRLFSRAPQQPDVSSWWTRANRLADAPTGDEVAALRASMLDEATFPDQAEAQQEMVEALATLLTLTTTPTLPVVATQHRVIGTDTCHHLVPAALVEPPDGGGKLFVTSARLIYAAGTVQAWPWHLVARIRRMNRDLLVELKSRPPIGLRLNTYEDAVVIHAIAASLLGQTPSNRP
jgi:hypothetical protein